MQIETAAVATWRQLIDVHTGEGVLPTIWHTYGIIGRCAPQLARPMLAARQQQGEFHFTVINDVQYPVALLSMALLPLILLASRRKNLGVALGELDELTATVILALLANAFVCGALSNPHDRYSARMVWLASFVVLLALIRLAAPRLGKTADLA